MRVEKLHLDRAITASSAPKLTGLSSLDGKMSAAANINKPARAGRGSEPMVTAAGPTRGPEQPLRGDTLDSDENRPFGTSRYVLGMYQ